GAQPAAIAQVVICFRQSQRYSDHIIASSGRSYQELCGPNQECAYPCRCPLRLLPSTNAFDLIRIFVISAAVGFFTCTIGAFVLEHDAAGYEAWADAIVSGKSLVGQGGLDHSANAGTNTSGAGGLYPSAQRQIFS